MLFQKKVVPSLLRVYCLPWNICNNPDNNHLHRSINLHQSTLQKNMSFITIIIIVIVNSSKRKFCKEDFYIYCIVTYSVAISFGIYPFMNITFYLIILFILTTQVRLWFCMMAVMCTDVGLPLECLLQVFRNRLSCKVLN